MLSLPSSPNNAACALLLSVKAFNDNNNNDNNSDNFFLAHYIKNLNALTKSSRHLGSRILYINDYSVKTIQRTRLACLKIKSEKGSVFKGCSSRLTEGHSKAWLHNLKKRDHHSFCPDHRPLLWLI